MAEQQTEAESSNRTSLLHSSLSSSETQDRETQEEATKRPVVQDEDGAHQMEVEASDCLKRTDSELLAAESGTADSGPLEVSYVPYSSELQLPDVMRLMKADLSEPYSIYTYRYFIHNWPNLCFLVATEIKSVLANFTAGFLNSIFVLSCACFTFNGTSRPTGDRSLIH